jgi:hypothetical protein
MYIDRRYSTSAKQMPKKGTRPGCQFNDIKTRNISRTVQLFGTDGGWYILYNSFFCPHGLYIYTYTYIYTYMYMYPIVSHYIFIIILASFHIVHILHDYLSPIYIYIPLILYSIDIPILKTIIYIYRYISH